MTQPRLISVTAAAYKCGYGSLQGFSGFRKKHPAFPKPVAGTHKFDEMAVNQFLDKLNDVNQQSNITDWDKIVRERIARRGGGQSALSH